ncbi:addiction module protein [Cellvibrio mixtus]|uniref:Protein adenylyltransferase n=1 Tax=Cellvibrio mixtus TaxID=39650 RepID=A0A266QCB3_9GAMM|nr:Fic family protein [Cellvibrio mixtus]OZY87544.1 addiction module protein [Cellvibrio mixtus]
MSYVVTPLPIADLEQIETRATLKKAALAHRYLAELKGIAETIPNEAILINTLALQEAKHSSEIENIITTQDELFKAELFTDAHINPAAKEVQNYAVALKTGFEFVRKSGLIRISDLLTLQEILEENKAGFRKLPGTELKNAQTGKVVYTPPQHPQDIERLMDNLATYINDADLCTADPLIKMAIIHHQFESIHPFYDGNGRTGRIINMLYLVAQGLLDLPILYLSRYLIQTKAEYYQQLQAVRDTNEWEPWLIYILDGVIQTAQATIELIKQIKILMQDYKQKIRSQLPKIYSQELLNNLFNHPYTKIEFVMQDLSVSRLTAAKYLEQLVGIGLLKKEKISRSNYYINQPLLSLFLERG